jgi:hypothetical protein
LKGPLRGAEVGVEEGIHALELLAALPQLEALKLVDSWQPYEQCMEGDPSRFMIVDRNDGHYQRVAERMGAHAARTEIVRARSVEAAATVPAGSLDFVYIDACHSTAEVQQDIRAWAPKVREGGVVAGHDYRTWQSVRTAVDREALAGGRNLREQGNDWWFVVGEGPPRPDSPLYVVHDPRYHSMVRPAGEENRVKAEDPRWTMPRFLERVEQYLPVQLVEVWRNPPADARAVWFALPDPAAPDVVKHYQHWTKMHQHPTHVVNHPETLCMSKREWYFVLNMHGVRAPHPTTGGWFSKTLFHGHGPNFCCEYIESRHINAQTPQSDNPNHKVWRLVYFDGAAADSAAYLEESGYWVQSGGAQVREMKPAPPELLRMTQRVAEVSGLRYFHAEVIPSPWVGPVVVDVNPHPFDVMEGRLNDEVLPRVVSTVRGWLS